MTKTKRPQTLQPGCRPSTNPECKPLCNNFSYLVCHRKSITRTFPFLGGMLQQILQIYCFYKSQNRQKLELHKLIQILYLGAFAKFPFLRLYHRISPGQRHQLVFRKLEGCSNSELHTNCLHVDTKIKGNVCLKFPAL